MNFSQHGPHACGVSYAGQSQWCTLCNAVDVLQVMLSNIMWWTRCCATHLKRYMWYHLCSAGEGRRRAATGGDRPPQGGGTGNHAHFSRREARPPECKHCLGKEHNRTDRGQVRGKVRGSRVLATAAREVAAKVANAAANEAVDTAAHEAAKQASNEAANKAATEAANEANTEAANHAASEAANKAANEANNEAATRAADEAATEANNEAADPTASSAANGAMQRVAVPGIHFPNVLSRSELRYIRAAIRALRPACAAPPCRVVPRAAPAAQPCPGRR